MKAPDTHPYSRLTPDVVLNALDALGLRCDGRLLSLNSYENRVYQVGQEEGLPLVAKFYRPARWSEKQILEEHAFASELAEAEVPVVAPIVLNERTLHDFEGFAFAVYPRQGGRAPELEDPKALEWIGRFIGRIHAIGGTAAYRVRPAIDIASFGDEPRRFLVEHRFIPTELMEAWTSIADLALEGVRAAFARTGKYASLRLHGDCHAGNVLWKIGRASCRERV